MLVTINGVNQFDTFTSNTTYYLIYMTDLADQSIIGFNGASDASTEVLAVCGYL